MTEYTFPKVEHRATKTTKCGACGKRLKRSTTFWQTLSPFNKTSDGNLKTREQIGKELRVAETEWRAEREWCAPCFEATHVNAKDLVVGNVLESDIGDFPVTSVDTVKNAPGYHDTIRVNAGTDYDISFSPYDRVLTRAADADVDG